MNRQSPQQLTCRTPSESENVMLIKNQNFHLKQHIFFLEYMRQQRFTLLYFTFTWPMKLPCPVTVKVVKSRLSWHEQQSNLFHVTLELIEARLVLLEHARGLRLNCNTSSKINVKYNDSKFHENVWLELDIKSYFCFCDESESDGIGHSGLCRCVFVFQEKISHCDVLCLCFF